MALIVLTGQLNSKPTNQPTGLKQKNEILGENKISALITEYFLSILLFISVIINNHKMYDKVTTGQGEYIHLEIIIGHKSSHTSQL